MEDPKPPQTTPLIETPTPTPTPTPNPSPSPSPNPNPNPNPNPDSSPSPNPKPDSNPDPNPTSPSTTQKPPPQPPNLPQESKKRPLDQKSHIQNSNYFKMRAVFKDLRPHFIEVLRTPVFQNCIPANEIREQMKLLMDLYKEITAETISTGKCKNMLEGQVSSENHDGQKPIEHHQPSPDDRAFAKASEEKQTQGSHIVGGSAFGWNFITYQGSKAIYYGRTKEMFRSANVIPQGSPS